jgi:pimeloyl-ACP methyl ester carboxylesterase
VIEATAPALARKDTENGANPLALGSYVRKPFEDWRSSGLSFSYRGHEIFYRRGGEGDVLVLIHGFPTASWDWHRIWPALVSRYDVIAMDMIGFGFSAKPTDYDYSLMDQASLHEALLAALNVNNVHIVAHDYGDSVAQELLARHAERQQHDVAGLEIQSACLLNGGIIPGTHRPLAIQKVLMSPIGRWVAVLMRESSLRRSFKRIFGRETQPTDEELHEFWTLIDTGGGRAVVHKIIRYMHEREQQRKRWVDILSSTSVPLRLINGLADPISGAHVVEHYRSLVTHPDVIELDGMGHYPQIEDPKRTSDAVISHIEAARSHPG